MSDEAIVDDVAKRVEKGDNTIHTEAVVEEKLTEKDKQGENKDERPQIIHKRKRIIAVDMTGGDHLPIESLSSKWLYNKHTHETDMVSPIERAVMGIRLLYQNGGNRYLRIKAVGPGEEIRRTFMEYDVEYLLREKVEIIDTPNTLSMDDVVMKPKQYRDTPIGVALRLHQEGEAKKRKHKPGTDEEDLEDVIDGVFSAGNTSHIVTAAFFELDKIRRPLLDRKVRVPMALLVKMPSLGEDYVMLDLGASVDVDGRGLYDFALMGAVYAEHVLGRKDYRLGLLNIGEERGKGKKYIHDAAVEIEHRMGIEDRFIGNIEPWAIYQGKVDVVITDGEKGNVYLKTSEAAARFMSEKIKEKIRCQDPLKRMRRMTGAAMIKDVFRELKSETDPSYYGAALLVGIRGVVGVGHGVSDEKAFYYGIKRVDEAIAANVEPIIYHHLTTRQQSNA